MAKLAALDLGSNSFHLLDAICYENKLHWGTRIKEKVQIGAGLGPDQILSQEAIDRGLTCLKSFKTYIDDHNIQHINAAGTFTLRTAKNSHEFISAAEALLNCPIEVISGKEEARLIFSAVKNEVKKEGTGLVIDIGGGSTEFAVGNQSQTKITESLEMGCVSYYKRFFADGKVYIENIRAAEAAARAEIEPHLENFLSEPNHWIAGTSGTLQSIATLTHHLFNDPENILSLDCLEALDRTLIDTGHVNFLKSRHLDDNRRAILPAGLAIVRAIFSTLGIEQMQICQSALCEGLLLELSEQTCS